MVYYIFHDDVNEIIQEHKMIANYPFYDNYKNNQKRKMITNQPFYYNLKNKIIQLDETIEVIGTHYIPTYDKYGSHYCRANVNININKKQKSNKFYDEIKDEFINIRECISRNIVKINECVFTPDIDLNKIINTIPSQ